MKNKLLEKITLEKSALRNEKSVNLYRDSKNAI